MASKVSVPAFRGVLVPASLCRWENLAANDNTGVGSSWTAADPGPGGMTPDDPYSQFRAEISGALDRDVDLVVRAGGFASGEASYYGSALNVREPVRLGYRYPEDTTADGGDYPGPAGDGAIRGWDTPSVVRGHKQVIADTSAGASTPSACVVPSTQLVVVATVDQTAGRVRVATWDPYTDTASATVTLATPVLTAVCCAIMCLPGSERLVIYVYDYQGWSAYFSDDNAATWDLFAQDVIPLTAGVLVADVLKMTALAGHGGDVSLWLHDVGAGTGAHFASTDGGSSFAAAGGGAVTSTTWVGDACMTPDGRIVYVYATSGASDYGGVVTWASPGDVANSGTLGMFGGASGGTLDGAYVAAEPNGTVWILATPNGAGALQLWRAEDPAGSSSTLGFVRCCHGPIGMSATQPGRGCLVAAAGALHLVHGAYVGPNGAVFVDTLGGWSNVVAGEDLDGVTQERIDQRRIGYGDHSTAGTSAAVSLSWLPWTDPATAGWTAAGAGTAAMAANVASGDLVLTTTGADAITYTKAIGTLKGASMHAILTPVSGGSLAALTCGALVVIADGTVNHQISIRVSATASQVQAFDEIAGTSIGTAWSFTAGGTTRIELAIHVRQFTSTADHLVECYARLAGSKVWTLIGSSPGTLANGGVLAAGYFQWGHPTGTAVSNWRLVAGYAQANTGSPPEWLIWRGSPVLARVSGKSDPGHWPVIGYPCGPRPGPLGENTPSVNAAAHGEVSSGAPWVRAVGGPARFGERFACAVGYGYGPERMFSEVCPSPADGWRSVTDKGGDLEMWFNFVADYARTLGSWSVALFLDKINFRYAKLQEWTGAAWSTIGTFDADVGNGGTLKWTRTGATVTVTATSPAGARFFGDGSLVGGTFSLDGYLRKIAENTAGVWSDADTMQIVIRLDGIDGTEAASGTIGEIWAPSGVLVVHKRETPRTRYRVLLESQPTAETDRRIGCLMLGGFIPFGRQWSDGFAFDADPNVDMTEDERGTTYADPKGDVKRTWTVAWVDGVLTRQLESSAAPTPDFLATSTATAGKALAARNDVAALALGVLGRLQGKACVLLRSVPTSDSAAHMITDPSMFLYSRMVSPLRVEHVAGPEERGGWSAGSPAARPAGQVLRISPIKFAGIV